MSSYGTDIIMTKSNIQTTRNPANSRVSRYAGALFKKIEISYISRTDEMAHDFTQT